MSKAKVSTEIDSKEVNGVLLKKGMIVETIYGQCKISKMYDTFFKQIFKTGFHNIPYEDIIMKLTSKEYKKYFEDNQYFVSNLCLTNRKTLEYVGSYSSNQLFVSHVYKKIRKG